MMRLNKGELEKKLSYRLLKTIAFLLFFVLLLGWDFVDDELLGGASEKEVGVILVSVVTVFLSAIISFLFWKLSIYVLYGRKTK